MFGRNKIQELEAQLASLQVECGKIKSQLVKVSKERDQAHGQIEKAKRVVIQTRKERDEIKAAFSEVQRMEAYGLKKAIEELRVKRDELNAEERELSQLIEKKRAELVVLDEELLLQSFGLYTPRYEFESSQLFKVRLDDIRKEQKAMIKDDSAVHIANTWTVGGSEKEGKKMVKDYVKLILRSFNNECDASMVKIKYNNVQSIEKKIQKAFDDLNKLGERMTISISQQYLQMKLNELYLLYEYELKKQEEKEEQKRIREEMREEARLLKELEIAKEKLRKEEKHFNQALSNIEEQLEKAESETEKQIMEAEKARIEEQLQTLVHDLESVEQQEQNTRAGYVYVISNIGSLGEGIYKIGMTRRLEPQERVDELGDASVPFGFDIHALIFSEDAPGLENALHREFEDRRVNLVNRRREFFRVSLDEIEQVIRNNFDKPVNLIRTPEAPEYRQTTQMRTDKILI